jgi:hypothetical protein
MDGDRPRATMATVILPIVTARDRFRRALIGSVAALEFFPAIRRRVL